MATQLENSWQAIHLSSEKTSRLVTDLKQAFPVERRCVPNFLLDQADKYRSKILFSCTGNSLTYEQAPQTAARWGAALTALDVKKGDRIVFLCSNSFTFLEIFWMRMDWRDCCPDKYRIARIPA